MSGILIDGPFTDAAVAALAADPPTDTEHWHVDHRDPGCPGLILRVFRRSKAAAGSERASWLTRVRLVFDAKPALKWVSLGYYPATSLAEARQRAALSRAAVKEGKDPREDPAICVKAARKLEESRRTETFGKLAQDFMLRHVKRKKLAATTTRDYQRALFVECREWQDRPVTEITKREIVTKLDYIADGKGSLKARPIWANRFLTYLRRFLGWCAERDALTVVPTDRVPMPSKNVRCKRPLRAEEIPEVWNAFEAEGFPYGEALKLTLLTGQRRDEVSFMTWEEVSGLETTAPTWMMAAHRVKNKQPHTVPLSPAAADILRRAPRGTAGDFVFYLEDGKKAISALGHAKERIDRFVSRAREARGVGPMPRWRIHDLRHTCRSLLGALGVPPNVAECVINHTAFRRIDSMGYDHHDYAAERRAALDRYAAYLMALIARKHSPGSQQGFAQGERKGQE